jgi:hypothetical protein
VGWHFLPLIIVMFLHWAVAGLDRGHLHLSDEVKARSGSCGAGCVRLSMDCFRLGDVRWRAFSCVGR